jgi:hypothetical protein
MLNIGIQVQEGKIRGAGKNLPIVPDLSKTKFRENIPEFLFKIMYYYKIRQY